MKKCGNSRPTRSRRASTFSSATLLVAPLAVAPQTHGPPIDYAGIVLAATVSWFGLPGPGEAVLIGAGLLASHHRLDIWMVIGAAALGATAGGVAGWLVGMKASRPVMIGRGPLWRPRRFLLAKGERFFERHGPLGVFLAPSWAAGVNNMSARRFIPLNAIAAVGWAAVYGAAAFLLGPSVADALGDYGALLPIAVVALIVVFLVLRRLRRGPRFLRRRKIGLREG